jgi:hypothetical protein
MKPIRTIVTTMSERRNVVCRMVRNGRGISPAGQASDEKQAQDREDSKGKSIK